MVLPVNQSQNSIPISQTSNIGGGISVGLGSDLPADGLGQQHIIGGGRLNYRSPIQFTEDVPTGSNGGGDFNYYKNYETSVQGSNINTDYGDFTINDNDKTIYDIMNMNGDTILNNAIGDIINIDNSQGDSILYNTIMNVLDMTGDQIGDSNIYNKVLKNLIDYLDNNSYDNLRKALEDLENTGGVESLNDLNDVNTLPSDEDVLTYNSDSGLWEASEIGDTLAFAEIIQSLQRADSTTDPPTEAVSTYRIRLLTDSTATYVRTSTYEEGATVKYTKEGENLATKFEATKNVPAGVTPTNPAYWLELDDIEADVYHYEGNLLDSIPWFTVGETVQVYKDDNDDYHILQTAIDCAGDGDHFSLMWDEDEGRAKAVFA